MHFTVGPCKRETASGLAPGLPFHHPAGTRPAVSPPGRQPAGRFATLPLPFRPAYHPSPPFHQLPRPSTHPFLHISCHSHAQRPHGYPLHDTCCCLYRSTPTFTMCIILSSQNPCFVLSRLERIGSEGQRGGLGGSPRSTLLILGQCKVKAMLGALSYSRPSSRIVLRIPPRGLGYPVPRTPHARGGTGPTSTAALRRIRALPDGRRAGRRSLAWLMTPRPSSDIHWQLPCSAMQSHAPLCNAACSAGACGALAACGAVLSSPMYLHQAASACLNCMLLLSNPIYLPQRSTLCRKGEHHPPPPSLLSHLVPACIPLDSTAVTYPTTTTAAALFDIPLPHPSTLMLPFAPPPLRPTGASARAPPGCPPPRSAAALRRPPTPPAPAPGSPTPCVVRLCHQR
jgi:hypothetical protein